MDCNISFLFVCFRFARPVFSRIGATGANRKTIMQRPVRAPYFGQNLLLPGIEMSILTSALRISVLQI